MNFTRTGRDILEERKKRMKSGQEILISRGKVYPSPSPVIQDNRITPFQIKQAESANNFKPLDEVFDPTPGRVDKNGTVNFAAPVISKAPVPQPVPVKKRVIQPTQTMPTAQKVAQAKPIDMKAQTVTPKLENFKMDSTDTYENLKDKLKIQPVDTRTSISAASPRPFRRKLLDGISEGAGALRAGLEGAADKFIVHPLERLSTRVLFNDWSKDYTGTPDNWKPNDILTDETKNQIKDSLKQFEGTPVYDNLLADQFKRQSAIQYKQKEGEELRDSLHKPYNWTPDDDKLIKTANEVGGTIGGFGQMAVLTAVTKNPFLGGFLSGAISSYGEGAGSEEMLKEGIKSGAFMLVGGKAGKFVGNKLENVIENSPLKNTILGAVANKLGSGAAFGAAGTATEFVTSDKKPAMEDFARNMLAGALFEAIPGTLFAIKGAKGNQGRVFEGMNNYESKMKQGYYEARRAATPEEAAAKIDELIAKNQDVKEGLRQNKFTGASKQVKQAQEALSMLDDILLKERSMYTRSKARGLDSNYEATPTAETMPIPSQIGQSNIVNRPAQIEGLKNDFRASEQEIKSPEVVYAPPAEQPKIEKVENVPAVENNVQKLDKPTGDINKPSNLELAEAKKYYIKSNKEFVPVSGNKIEVKGHEGLDIFVHKPVGKTMGYAVSEGKSGASISKGKTKAEAIANAKTYLDGLTTKSVVPSEHYEKLAEIASPSPRYKGIGTVTQTVAKESIPLDHRTYDMVSSRSVKAYQYEHPELKPHIQGEASRIITELKATVKGERIATTNEYGETKVVGIPKFTSLSIQRIQDATGASYEKIGKALEDIVSDGGSENTALAKKIELIIDDNLSSGVKDIAGNEVPINELYVSEKARIEGKSVSPTKIEEEDDLPIIGSKTAKPIERSINNENRIEGKGTKTERNNPGSRQNDVAKKVLDRATKTMESYGKQGAKAEIVEATTTTQKQIKDVLEGMGFNVHYYESNEKFPASEVYDPQNKSIILVKSDNASDMLWAAGHGFFHGVKANHPDLYKEVLDVLENTITPEQTAKYLDTFSSTPEYQDKLGKDRDAIIEEMLADESGNVFTDKSFWDTIYNKSKELFDKLVSIAKQLFSKITRKEYNNYFTGKQIDKFRAKFEEIVTEVRKRNGDTAKQEVAAAIETELEPEEVRFSMKEVDKDLVALHNVSEDKLLKAIELGGIPVPSIAITKDSIPFTSFGGVTLVGGKDMVDPSRSALNKVFDTDVYSKRQPRPEYPISSKEVSKIFSRVRDSFEAVGDYIWDVEDRVNQENPDTVVGRFKDSKGYKYQFLKEKGIAPAVPKRPQQLRHEIFDNEIMKGFIRKYGTDIDNNYDSPARVQLVPYVKQSIETYAENKAAETEEKYKNFFIESHSKTWLVEDDGIIKIKFNKFDDLLRDLQTLDKRPMVIDEAKLKTLMDKKFTKSRIVEYEAWVKDLFTPVYGKPYILDGSRKVDYNLENSFSIMKGNIRGQEGNMTFGAAKAKAVSSKEFKSIEEIHKGKDSLVSREELDSITDKLDKERDILAEELYPKYPDQDRWAMMDDMYKTIANYLKGAKTEANMITSLRRNGFKDVNIDTMQRFMDYAMEIKNAPVQYFEAKPQRIVRFDEFKAALVPKRLGTNIVQKLKEAGVGKVIVYDGSVGTGEDAWLEALDKTKKIKDVRFSAREKRERNSENFTSQKAIEKGITIPYLRNLEKAPKIYSDDYAQSIEPSGEYVNYDAMEGKYKLPNWEYGAIEFKKPLVLEYVSTGHGGWKTKLSEMYGGKKGKALSSAIQKDGHDAVVTIDSQNKEYREIVNLSGIKANNDPSLSAGDKDERLKPWGEPLQEISSADTSINATRLPSTFSRVKFENGTINADIGGGRFDNATEHLKGQGATNIIYDPYNRTPDHNRESIKKISGGKSDTATINNVLNVIQESASREQVILNAADAIKPDGTAYFLIYEGDSSGNSKATSKGWQENRTAKSYIPEIKKYFASVTSRGNLLVATQPLKENVQKLSMRDKEQRLAKPFFSKLEKTIEAKMPNAAMTFDIKNIIKSAGIKEDEVKWSGINDFLADKTKVKKEDVLEFLKMNEIYISEVTKGTISFDEKVALAEKINEYVTNYAQNRFHGGYDDRMKAAREKLEEANDPEYIKLNKELADAENSKTKFGSYQLPGGKNYKELLFRLPRQPMHKEDYYSSHWDEKNVLAHTRLNDRVDAEGNKVLFVEEIQSDWHQEGRKKGYKKVISEANLPEGYKVINMGKYDVDMWVIKDNDGKVLTDFGSRSTKEGILNEYFYAGNKSNIPEAPYSKTWHEFVFKRLLRYAAENGYDKISWTTGEQQNERYDLSKTLDKVEIYKIEYPESEAGWQVKAYKKGSHENDRIAYPEIHKTAKTDVELESLIGKELAARAINEINTNIARQETEKIENDPYGVNYSGVDLEIGGSGMKGFYDKILPEFVQKYVKKWGAKVEESIIGDDLRNTSAYKSGGLGEIKRIAKESKSPGITTQWSVAITDAMKDSVLYEGQPQYSMREKETRTRGVFESVKNNPNTPKEILDRLKNNLMTYEVRHNEETMGEAAQLISEDRSAAMRRAKSEDDEATPVTNAIRIYFMAEAFREKRFDDAYEMVDILAQRGTALGQAVQMYAILKRLTPEGSIYFANRELEKAKTDEQKANISKKSKALSDKLNEVNKEAADEVAEEVKKEIERIKSGGKKKPKKEGDPETETSDELTPEELLAERIKAYMEDPIEKDADPIRDMINTLFKVAQQTLPDRDKPKSRDAIEFIAEAVQKREEYKRVWDVAQNIIKQQYAGDQDVLDNLDDYFNDFLEQPFSDNQLNRAVRKGIKDLDLDLTKLVKQHYSLIDNVGVILQKRLIQEAGLNSADAQYLATFIKREFERITANKKAAILEQIFREKPKAKTKELYQRIIEMSNLGAVSSVKFQPYVAKKFGLPALTPDMAARIQGYAEKIQTIGDDTYEKRREKAIQIALMMADIARQVPTGTLRKLSTLQTMVMLLAPRTISKNIIGNSLFGSLDLVKDYMAAGLDATLGKAISGERAVPMPKLRSYARGSIRAAREGYQDVKLGIDTSRSVTQFDLPKNYVFKSRIGILAQKAMDLTLKVPDRIFSDGAYQSHLDGLIELKKVEEPTEDMKEAAVYYSARKTFNDDNMMSSVLIGLRNVLNLKVGKYKGLDWFVGDWVLKFPKIPGAILMRGIEYSPASIFRALWHISKPLYEAKKNGTSFREEFGGKYQSKFINSLAEFAIGTAALVALGAWLRSLGIITGRMDDNVNVSNFERAVGMGEYRMNISALWRYITSFFNPEAAKIQDQDTIVNYDWAQPVAIGVSMGANLYDGKTEQTSGTSKALDLFSVIIQSVTSGAETITEMPLLKGVRTFFGGRNAIDGLVKTAESVPASFVPQLLNNIRQLMDNTSRNTYDPNVLKYVENLVLNRIPGASKTLPPSSDVFGNLKEVFEGNSNNLFNVFLNPAYVTKYKLTPEAMLVINTMLESGEDNIAPRTSPKSFTISIQGIRFKYVLSGEELSNFQRLSGDMTKRGFRTIDPRLPVDAKVEKMTDILNLAAKTARIKIISDRTKAGGRPDSLRR